MRAQLGPKPVLLLAPPRPELRKRRTTGLVSRKRTDSARVMSFKALSWKVAAMSALVSAVQRGNEIRRRAISRRHL